MRHPPAIVILLAVLGISSTVQARPEGPALFCEIYPESSTCAGRGTTCLTCHTSTSPTNPAWNAYGEGLLVNLTDAITVPGVLADAAEEIESDDSDDDGLSNLEEILLGTLPGDSNSYYALPVAGRGAANPRYALDSWDAEFALRRMMVAFCGRSPSYLEVLVFADADDQKAHVHEKLDECLALPFWTREGLARLADERVRPLDLGTSWQWDYRLWRYVMSGDRDVRDLLTADYHVREAVQDELVRIDNPTNDLNACTQDDQCAGDHFCFTDDAANVCVHRDGMQGLVQEERAGMIGTSWFHAIFTMFSDMPRTTAAQAMRGYLGQDIARMQGIAPIPAEPLDVDNKNVDQVECAQCHATLDPATYVFAKYRGIESQQAAASYDPNRPIEKGLWTVGNEPQGMLFGQPVSTLREWGEVAASSDAFQINLANILFEYAIGRPPGPQDKDEFDALWASWPSAQVAWSANRFIHSLVDTNAFGAP